mmetsp:Transcript_6780/g.16841  ORF Transcript_6780/g.16841 Transcript_6780/m.16841 type:complete len:245 (+) Transcript_6780:161-895(+)
MRPTRRSMAPELCWGTNAARNCSSVVQPRRWLAQPPPPRARQASANIGNTTPSIMLRRGPLATGLVATGTQAALSACSCLTKSGATSTLCLTGRAALRLLGRQAALAHGTPWGLGRRISSSCPARCLTRAVPRLVYHRSSALRQLREWHRRRQAAMARLRPAAAGAQWGIGPLREIGRPRASGCCICRRGRRSGGSSSSSSHRQPTLHHWAAPRGAGSILLSSRFHQAKPSGSSMLKPEQTSAI